MSSPVPEDQNEYVVLHAVTAVDRTDYPRYDYPGRLPAVPPEAQRYDYIGMQKPEYDSYVEEFKPPHEYLQLDDCTYENPDYYNYYEDITYEKQEQKSSSIIRILIAVVTLLVVLIAILTGVLSWNFYWSKGKQSSEPQFCTDPASQQLCRQLFVRNMTHSAFSAYQNYAWGAPEFKPIALEAYSNNNGHGRGLGIFPGLTIVDAMDTLWIMGMKEEWDQGKQWILNNLHITELDQMVRAKEVFLGYLAGLLSAYALSGDEDFLHKSIEVMEALKLAFNNATGMLAYKFNPKVKFNAKSKVEAVQRVRVRMQVVNGQVVNSTEPMKFDYLKSVPDPEPILELVNFNSIGLIGFQQPEFIYLANLTGDFRIEERLLRSRMVMSNIDRPKGLYVNYLDADTGIPNSTYVGLFDETTGFYYNMIRSYIQLGRQDAQLLKMYIEAIEKLQRMELFKRIGGQLFVRRFDTKSQLHMNNMDDSSCLVGGMLALGARELQAINYTNYEEHWELAAKLTETCHHAANSTITKLLPHKFTLNNNIVNEGWLDPNLAETYFILYRLTGDTKYQEWAWELTQALFKYCRTTSGGFAGIFNVQEIASQKYDYQNSVFLTGTLKYLYLIFSDKSILPLDEWIFNARGHPLPICGTNLHYPKNKCTF